MTAPASRMLVMAFAGLLALGGCSGYDDGYGYGGVSVGYGSGYYDYPRYGSYYGWYDGFYYPGSGYYVFDRLGKRHRWSDHHRHYWEGRRHFRDGRKEWREGRRDRHEWRSSRRDDRLELDRAIPIVPDGGTASPERKGLWHGPDT